MLEKYYIIIPLVAGFIVDAILGDPHWLPHPVRFFGRTISLFERSFNKGKRRKLKGTFVALFLISAVFMLFLFLDILFRPHTILYVVFASFFIFYGLANRSLITEVLKVDKQLDQNGLDAARKQLSFIVGRDTNSLSEDQVRTAALETLAENLSDGVIAPMFYYLVGGIPLMMAYKMANTLDSMIGYKDSRFEQFGYFAAKTDDMLNFIPARLTAFLMALITFSKRGMMFIFRYGNKHSSPNAGYPEAALAGILNCRFGGPNMYHSKFVDKPFIGNNDRCLTKKDILKGCLVNVLTSSVFLLIGVLLMILRIGAGS